MAITPSDILIKLSVTSGSAGNSNAGTPAGSFGKYISTTEITDASANNLFDDVSGDENAASDVEYRCFFVHNNHGTLTWQAPVVYISAEVGGGATTAIAVDSTAASAIGSASAQALEIIDEEDSTTVLSGLSFSAPASKGTGLALSDIDAGDCKAIWVRRTATDSAALDNDGVTLTISGDTAA